MEDNLGDVQETQSEVSEDQTTETQTEATFSKPEVDSMISKALKTRDKNLNSKYEQLLADIEAKKDAERRNDLEATNKLVDELRAENQRLQLSKETEKALAEKNALDLLPLFDFDTSTVEGRLEFAGMLQNKMSESIQKQVKEKITTPAAPASKPNLVKEIGKMSIDEYVEWKKANNIK